MVDDRKNTIEVTPKKPEADIEEKNLSHWQNFFQILMRFLKKIKKMTETKV